MKVITLSLIVAAFVSFSGMAIAGGHSGVGVQNTNTNQSYAGSDATAVAKPVSNNLNQNYSNSQSGSRSVSAGGNQSIYFAGSEAPPRTLFFAQNGGFSEAGKMYFDPGRSVNAQIMATEMAYADFCNGPLPKGPHAAPVTKEIAPGVTIHYLKYAGTTSVPQSLRSVPVRYAEIVNDIQVGQKYYCLGLIRFVIDDDAATADRIGVANLYRYSKEFMKFNTSGHPHPLIVAMKPAFAYQRGTTGTGSAIGGSPQGVGMIGSIMAALPIRFSKSQTNANVYGRVGGVMLVVALAPDTACGCDGAVIAKGPSNAQKQAMRERLSAENKALKQKLQNGNAHQSVDVNVNINK